jgi:hypothetical protein
MRSTRSSAMGKVIAVAAGKARTDDCLTPPDIGSVSKDVTRRPVFPRNKGFELRRISVDKTKWWSDP